MEFQELVYWVVASVYAPRALRAKIRQQPAKIRELLHSSPDWQTLQEHLVREALILEEFLNQGGRVLTLTDPNYPTRLSERMPTQAPLVLFAVGNVSPLESPKSVAFVGARKPNKRAVELTQQVASKLAEQGYTVITGAAPGIDLSALEAALQARGKVITVLPQGLLISATLSFIRNFHTALNHEQLLILSEVHPKAPWSGSFAMMRNRIVAGLAEFVLIAETAPKRTIVNGKARLSGTWNCAEIAHRMGVPVFVFDLPIEGNKKLLDERIAQVWSDTTEPGKPARLAHQASLFDE